MSIRIGCDVGGTFTDFIFVDPAGGGISAGKELTTPSDPSEAILAGISAHAHDSEFDIGAADQLIHGTTLGINALLERRGARTGLLATQGFTDALDIRRCNRVDMYDLQGNFPEALIPRTARRGIDERVYSDGTVLLPLDETQARREIRSLLADGVESIAICTLHSYLNAVHEERLAEIVAEESATVCVSLSSRVAAEIKEFERSSTTAIDAYLKPRMQGYLTRLEERLHEQGFSGRMYLMLSGGTVVAADAGKRMPARIVESGPMAGAIAAQHFAARLGGGDVVSYDMGGTSAKSCVIRDGRIPITRDYEVDRTFRFKRGSGMPLTVPTVDLIEIGAGGGSIARIDALGLLKVGPDSAGAVPGPACYGRGGDRPTVTDADLVLGYLNPDYFLGGRLGLDVAASRRALDAHVAQPLGIDTLQAAWGVHRVVNEAMANAIKTAVAERGGNIYDTTMVGFGGAGPVHAAQLARALKTPRVLIPPYAGVVSALGFLLAPFAYDIVRTHKMLLDQVDFDRVELLAAQMEDEAARIVAEAAPDRTTTTGRFAELCFAGQGHPVMVPLADRDNRLLDAPVLRAAFFDAYRKRYGHCSETTPVELVSLRIVVSADTDTPTRLGALPAATTAAARKAPRQAFDEAAGGMTAHTVWDRYGLAAGQRVDGPALIEERETTTVVPSGARATVQDDGALLLEFGS